MVTAVATRSDASGSTERHWCWYESPGGGLPARDGLIEVAASGPKESHAVAKLVTSMGRIVEGRARETKVEKISPDGWELKSRCSNRHVRVTYIGRGEHLVAVAAFIKDYPKLKTADIDKVTAASARWDETCCLGHLDLNYLLS